MEACEQTLKTSILKGSSIEEVREGTLNAFKALNENITEEHLGSQVNKDFDKISADDIVKLRHLYAAIKDGFVKAEVVFGFEKEDMPTMEEDNQLEELNKSLGEING